MKKQVVIFLPSSKIGGTEKRFLRLWIFFQEKGYVNIKLIIKKNLYREAANIEELKSMTRYDVITLPNKRFRHLIPCLINLIKTFPKGTIFHCPLGYVPFIHTILRQKLIISFTGANFDEVPMGGSNLRSMFYYILSFSEAWKIDVLNSVAYAQIKNFPFVNPKKVLLTSGSFVDMNFYYPSKEKKNWLVFLGRFNKYDIKNVIKFVRSIPYVFTYLKGNGIQDAKFFILGYGVKEKEVKFIVKSNKYQGIPIECYYELNPQTILSKSKVFFSLQKLSNYPSKSLLEALACENLCIVTDVGETRMIAKEPFAFFVNANFTEQDLAICALQILKMPQSKFLYRSKFGREFVKREFSIEKSTNYYLGLYEL